MMSVAGSSTGTTTTEAQGSFSSLSSSSPSCVTEDLHLVNVTKHAPAWKYLKMYNLCFYSDKEGRVHCIFCVVNMKINASTTSSMNKHLRAKHRTKWKEVINPATSSKQACMNVPFPKKIKEKTRHVSLTRETTS